MSDVTQVLSQIESGEPNALSALMRGELDWIVMKALEKDRTRRYQTAIALANDVLRHLRNEPVQACPPSLSYRLLKTFKRHKAAAILSAVIAVSLLLALIGTSAGLVYAIRAWRVVDTARITEARLRKQADEAREAEVAERKKTQERQQEALWHLYVARQFPLMDALSKRDYGHLTSFLDALTPEAGAPDFRGWEYSYFRDQCTQRFPHGA